MISQDPFMETAERIRDLSDRRMRESYGISRDSFGQLPKEVQDMIIIHYWQTLRKSHIENGNKSSNSISNIESKIKTLKLFKKNR